MAQYNYEHDCEHNNCQYHKCHLPFLLPFDGALLLITINIFDSANKYVGGDVTEKRRQDAR